MPGNRTHPLRRPLSDLFVAALRVGGTRLFPALTRLLRSMRVLPRAYDPLRDPKSILIIALTPHLGDAIMLTPMVQALALAAPDTPLDLAVEEGAAALLDGMPGVRTLYRLRLGSTPPVDSWATIRRIAGVVREYWKHMRGCRPALCIMPRWGDDLFRAFYLAVLTGAPRRIGFSSAVGWPRYRLAPYRDRLLTEAYTGANGLHEPDRFLNLLEQAGLLPVGAAASGTRGLSLQMTSLAASVSWDALQSRLGLPAGPFAVIAPSASQPRKVWPVENWCQVMNTLSGMGLHVVLLSGKSDAALARQLAAACGTPATLAAGVTSVAESAALLQHAALFLGSDSGPGHIAGPLGTPTVSLFIASEQADADDPFSPARNRPMGPQVYSVRPAAAIAPCTTTCEAGVPHCIRQITPETVMRQVTQALHSEASV